MKVLKFTLKGKNAMFKKPEVNTYYYFTYGQVHKPALLGMLGAVLGYGGYNSMKSNDVFPEYYDILKDIKISIRPNATKGCFSKHIVSFNNSVGYASAEQGGNLIVKEQWLEDPSWDIYLLEDCEEAREAARMLLNRRCVYIPYLGKNDHMADMVNVEEVEAEEVKEASHIDCLFPKKWYEPDPEEWGASNPFKYEESLPMALAEDTNMYELESFVYTNMPLKKSDTKVYLIKGRNIIFY